MLSCSKKPWARGPRGSRSRAPDPPCDVPSGCCFFTRPRTPPPPPPPASAGRSSLCAPFGVWGTRERPPPPVPIAPPSARTTRVSHRHVPRGRHGGHTEALPRGVHHQHVGPLRVAGPQRIQARHRRERRARPQRRRERLHRRAERALQIGIVVAAADPARESAAPGRGQGCGSPHPLGPAPALWTPSSTADHSTQPHQCNPPAPGQRDGAVARASCGAPC